MSNDGRDALRLVRPVRVSGTQRSAAVPPGPADDRPRPRGYPLRFRRRARAGLGTRYPRASMIPAREKRTRSRPVPVPTWTSVLPRVEVGGGVMRGVGVATGSGIRTTASSLSVTSCSGFGSGFAVTTAQFVRTPKSLTGSVTVQVIEAPAAREVEGQVTTT